MSCPGTAANACEPACRQGFTPTSLHKGYAYGISSSAEYALVTLKSNIETVAGDPAARTRHVWEVLRVFITLGLTSFGGPVAHIGYFRREFVERRRWLDDAAFGDLVGLCQFLPGPASSQVGFSIGLLRAGWLGGLAALCGFTLPSVLLLLAFAIVAPHLGGPIGNGVLHGLKLVAVAVVAQAVWVMARRLCPDTRRAGIALAALVVLALTTTVYAQLMVIGLGALLGLWLLRSRELTAPLPLPATIEFRISRASGAGALLLFCALLAGLPALQQFVGGRMLAIFDGFYRSGALVFGGDRLRLSGIATAAGVVGAALRRRPAFRFARIPLRNLVSDFRVDVGKHDEKLVTDPSDKAGVWEYPVERHRSPIAFSLAIGER